MDFFKRPCYTNSSIFVFYKKYNLDLYYSYIFKRNILSKFDIFFEKIEYNICLIERDGFLTMLNNKLENSLGPQ